MYALETAHADPEEAPQLRRFEALYRGEFAFVWAAARHLGVAPGAIDDVVQDVFLTAYRRLDHLRFEVSPRAWLFGVTRKVSFRYRRGAARRTRRHDALAAVSPSPPRAPQQRHDDAQQLEHLLRRLSDVTRTVWEMTELLGMSAPEIASELRVPINTIYSRLRLAREQLQSQVADATLGGWTDAARREQNPPREASQRAWVVLLPSLGHGGGGGLGLIAWAKTQAAMTTTLIVTSAVVVGVAIRPSPAPAPAPTLSISEPAPTRAAAPPLPRPAAATPVVATPTPTPERRMSSRTAPVTATDAQARLAEEIAMIDRAHAQLAANDLTAALSTITAHAQRFPTGALADVREAAHIDALCRGGNQAEAAAIARRLVHEHPTSAVAQRFTNFSCPR